MCRQVFIIVALIGLVGFSSSAPQQNAQLVRAVARLAGRQEQLRDLHRLQRKVAVRTTAVAG
jgi:hypothetical protein